MNKKIAFDQEINFIKDERLASCLRKLVELLPDYFFEVPASSTGKYHPAFALGDGGLVRHTKVAVRIAYELLQDPLIGDKYTNNEKDLMIIALVIHDGIKYGIPKERYTRFDHPLLSGKFVRDNKDALNFSESEINFLNEVIASHMGIWNKDYDGNEILPIPKTKYQNFVHMCDYLSSKKFLAVSFDENNNIIC